MAGFRNAPSITEFAVGMRVRFDKVYYQVMDTWNKGKTALMLNKNGGYLHLHLDDPIDLDLDSIWVGRRYIREDTKDEALVLAFAADKRVIYASGAYLFINDPIWFKEQYDPLPLPAPESPVKVGELVWVQDEGGDWFGRVDRLEGEQFWIVGPHFTRPIEFDATITKLVPEKGEPK